jgi:membrane protein YdbS with pleckstrin-like domain
MPVRGLSYELFVTLIVTILQVLVIFIVFITWYVPRYEVDPEKIIYYRGDMLAERVLANTTSISNMRIKTGWLGNATGYGSIIIETSDTADRVRLTDIPDPQRAVAHLWELVRPDAQVEGEVPNLTTNEVVTGAENQFVEFKSSFQWDYRQQRVNKELHLPVIKNLAAFMNAQGGYVIIGVDDDGNLLGLSADLSSISKKNSDGFENMFNQSFNKMIGVEFRQYVDVTFPEIDGKQICILRVRPSEYPIFVNAKGKETFYIRAGNASQPLSISQAARYISRRFEEV